MKRNLIAMCCVAALACAGTASADVLAEDSAANYTEETFVSGANEGSGFGAWEFWNAAPTLADSAAGLCGDINSGNGVSFRFARDDDDAHYGYCNGYRGFNALNPGDVLTFKFTCAYCAGNRGLDLFANGGHSDEDKIANVINLSGDNEYSVNGVVITNNWAPHAVSEVTVTQLSDGIEIAIKRTSTEEGIDDLEYSTKVETSAKLTGIGLYAGGWDWNGGADVENYAFYVNDLKIEGEPPTDTLSLEGSWDVTSKEAELSFKVIRQNSEGTLDVALASSYPEFASVPNLVTFADGDTEVPFTVTATLQGSGNVAIISASAEGVAGDSFEVKGPNYRVNNGSESPVTIFPGKSADIWINWDGGARDDSKLSLTADPEDIVSVPTDWILPAEGDVYVQSSVTGLATGSAALVLSYDSVEMARCNFTVCDPAITLSGPSPARVGSTCVYSLYGDFPDEYEEIGLSIDDTAQIVSVEIDEALVDPDSFELWSGKTAKITVKFDDTGKVTLSAVGSNYSDALEIEVEAAPDYSKYIAYDDASLYVDGFDFAAVGEGTDKFQAWTEVFNNNEGDEHRSAGVTIVGNAPDAAALSDGSAFALYANGNAGDAEIRIRRPFVTPLSSGQAFSVVLSPNFRDGAKGVVLQGEWEGNWYDRVEFYCSGDDYAYKLNGGESVKLDWGYGTKLIEMTLQCAADGSSYTLSFSREGDADVTVEGLTFEGSVDGALFYSWNGGYGDENNFVFNSLSIEQVEEPVVQRAIGWAAGVWNPDAAGEYAFAVSATTEDIGEVALSVTPSDGALSLSTDTVDLTGVTEASFTVILSEANEGDSFVITATPADTTVSPIEYNVTVSGSYVTLSSDTWDPPLSAGEIWLALTASLSKYGTYAISSSDESVLTVPEASAAITVDSPSQSWFNVEIAGLGEATIYATAEGAEAPAAEFKFTIKPPEYVVLPPFEVVKGRGLAWKASEVAGASFRGTLSLLAGEEGSIAWTDLVEGEDYVTEGEGEEAKTIVLFDGPFFSGHSVGFVMGK